MHIILLAIAAIILACSAAMAENPFQFSHSGLIKVESLRAGGAHQDFIYGSSDVGLRYTIIDGLELGADLGLDSLQLDGQTSGTTFATGIIGSPVGKLSLGIPRLVMPDVFDVPALGGSEMLDIVLGLASGEVLRFLSYSSAAPTLRGLRYDGTFGKIKLAAAVQELGTRTKLSHAVAATYDLGTYSVSIGRADVDLGPSLATTTKLGLRGEKGKFSGGIVASHQELLGSWENTLNGFLAYRLNDPVTIEGQVFDIVTADDRYLAWGADVVYRHTSGLFVQTGLAQLSPTADRLVTLSLGYQF